MTMDAPRPGIDGQDGSVAGRNLHLLRSYLIGGNGGEAMDSAVKVDGKLYSKMSVFGYADAATGEVIAYGEVPYADRAFMRGRPYETFELQLGMSADGHNAFLGVTSGQRHLGGKLSMVVQDQIERTGLAWERFANEDYEATRDAFAAARKDAQAEKERAATPNVAAQKEVEKRVDWTIKGVMESIGRCLKIEWKK
jgi:hypothetical protein